MTEKKFKWKKNWRIKEKERDEMDVDMKVRY